MKRRLVLHNEECKSNVLLALFHFCFCLNELHFWRNLIVLKRMFNLFMDNINIIPLQKVEFGV